MDEIGKVDKAINTHGELMTDAELVHLKIDGLNFLVHTPMNESLLQVMTTQLMYEFKENICEVRIGNAIIDAGLVAAADTSGMEIKIISPYRRHTFHIPVFLKPDTFQCSFCSFEHQCSLIRYINAKCVNQWNEVAGAMKDYDHCCGKALQVVSAYQQIMQEDSDHNMV